ncbi:MAG: hypothetical protein AAFY72_04365 [Cyanobacteria bacterium J06649_4]
MQLSSKDITIAYIFQLNGGDGFEFLERGSSALKAVKRNEMDAESVASLSSLLSALPYAPQMRCHLPGFAMEILYADGGFVRSSFCFQCNNIMVVSSHVRHTLEFDASSRPAKALRDFLVSKAPQL